MLIASSRPSISSSSNSVGMAKAASARNRRRSTEGRASAGYRASTGFRTSSRPSAPWTLPGRRAHRSRSPNRLNTKSGCRRFDWKRPFHIASPRSPCTGLGSGSGNCPYRGGRFSAVADRARRRSSGPAGRSGRRVDHRNHQALRYSQGVRVVPSPLGVERSFAWLGRCRRLAKYVEATIENAVAWMTIASIRLMIRRLARA